MSMDCVFLESITIKTLRKKSKRKLLYYGKPIRSSEMRSDPSFANNGEDFDGIADLFHC